MYLKSYVRITKNGNLQNLKYGEYELELNKLQELIKFKPNDWLKGRMGC